MTPAEFERLAMDPFAKAVAPSITPSARRCRLANAVDFDDLLVLPVRMLQKHPEKLAQYRQRFRYILVDEYQDTNRAQYELIKLLGGEHGNVCVVGDDDQSIYGWRGADIRNILDFNKDFRTPTVVRLEENYRSTPQILDLANLVISANTSAWERRCARRAAAANRVTVVRSLDERDEAEFVVSEIDVASIGVDRSFARDDRGAVPYQRAESRHGRGRCAGTRCRIVSSARCAFTIVARFAISWRISS